MINSTDLEAFGYYDETDKETKTPLEMVLEFAETMGQPMGLSETNEDFTSSVELGFSLILEEADEFEEAHMQELFVGKPSEHTLKELLDLIYVAYGYAARRGWDVDTALVDLHENNMGRCIWPDGTIHRREDGKVMKNPDHPKLNLSKYVKWRGK